jgi:DNA-binding NtrC family response regulator
MVADEHGCVLVVDDTPENLDLVRKALEETGCEVMVATSGERALEEMPGASASPGHAYSASRTAAGRASTPAARG